jgi:hypothetical protein
MYSNIYVYNLLAKIMGNSTEYPWIQVGLPRTANDNQKSRNFAKATHRFMLWPYIWLWRFSLAPVRFTPVLLKLNTSWAAARTFMGHKCDAEWVEIKLVLNRVQ